MLNYRVFFDFIGYGYVVKIVRCCTLFFVKRAIVVAFMFQNVFFRKDYIKKHQNEKSFAYFSNFET